jgi:hypothetical protein
MIETPLGAPGAPRPASLQTAVDTLMAEAEKITAEIATLRCSLELAEHKRHKLVTALGSAVEALPKRAHEALNHRMQNLAKAMSPKRGRRPDSRQQAIIEYLATRAHYDEEVVKVAEVQAHLERLGYERLPHGYASNAMARLAGQGFAVKIRFARYRINGMHPEIVEKRVKMSQDDLARMKAREREIDEAEKRGRMGRR